MHKYHKIPNIFERDCTRGKNGALLSEDAPMEGVVAKPMVDLYGGGIGGARVLCKIKTRDFPPHYAGGAETDEGSESV